MGRNDKDLIRPEGGFAGAVVGELVGMAATLGRVHSAEPERMHNMDVRAHMLLPM